MPNAVLPVVEATAVPHATQNSLYYPKDLVL